MSGIITQSDAGLATTAMVAMVTKTTSDSMVGIAARYFYQMQSKEDGS